MSSTTSFRPFAETNFSQSGASGLYDRSRPRYPPSALSQIVSLLPNQSTVVELGSGTGIFSRALILQGKEKLKKLVCVEPAEGMRIGFEDKLRGVEVGGTEISVVDGAFEEIPVEDGGADMIVAAQAFHWIGTDGTKAIQEFYRVLKPGGSLVLIWNMEDRSTEWVGKLRDAYEIYEAGTPQYRHQLWQSIFNLPLFISSFSTPPPALHKFSQIFPATEQLVIDRMNSKSYITALSESEREMLDRKAREVVQEGEGLKWVDREQGLFEYPYETDLWISRRT